jgi:hypothetical protein
MIAGIVLASHATLATRNVKHFEDIAAPVVNPWEKSIEALTFQLFTGLDPANLLHPLGELFFAALLGGVVVAVAFERVWQAIHLGYAAFFIVSVAVAFAIVEFLHQLGGRVAQMERNRLLASVFDLLLDSAPGGVDGVGLGGEREINNRFGEGKVAFRGAEKLHCLFGGEAEIQRLGCGEADVFYGHADDAASEIKRVFSGGEHAGEPVERGVGVGVAHAFVQGGDEVVMLFAGFIVEQDALLDGFGGDGTVNVLAWSGV